MSCISTAMACAQFHLLLINEIACDFIQTTKQLSQNFVCIKVVLLTFIFNSQPKKTHKVKTIC